VLKPLYMRGPGALRHGMHLLAAGVPVGLFPEGTVNRDPQRLKPGHKGAAYLSLRSGAPVIPVGIRFPGASDRISDRAEMEVVIGAPLTPPIAAQGHLTRAELDAWHATLMNEIARLSGKTWDGARGPASPRPDPP
jgi:1-acyl-sn-glycerol-3-phosphate acyltransferase